MIFLGAGASVPFKIPTTQRFTLKIEELLNKKNHKFLEAFKEYHEKIYKEQPNFEHILTSLRASTYQHEIRREHYTHSFFALYSDYNVDYSAIIDNMYQIVYEYCCNPFELGNETALTIEELEHIFRQTYDMLFGVMEQLSIHDIVFTTNYDPSLEIWCQKRNVRLIDGTVKTNNIEVNKYLGPELHLKELQRGKGHLSIIRMHGSVWYGLTTNGHIVKFTRPKNMLQFKDLYTEILEGRPTLLFPGQENQIIQNQWYSYYERFRNELQGNCLFIGYSFSHSPISDTIRDAVKNRKINKFGILSPDPEKNLQNLFPNNDYPDNKIVLLQGHFGEQDGIDALGTWFSNIKEGIDFKSAHNMTLVSESWRKLVESQYIRE